MVSIDTPQQYEYDEEPASAPVEPDRSAYPRERRRRRRRRAVAAVLVLAAAGGAAAVLLSDGDGDSGASANRTKLDAVPVTRADLVDRQSVDGKLGYAGTYSVNAAAPGPDKEPPSAGNNPNKPQGGGGTPGPTQSPGGGSAPGSGPGAGTGGGQGGTPPDSGNNASPGTITWLPGIGDTLSRGDRVYGRDGTKVPLFYGETPFWRALYVGVEKGV
ncbi:hypothetical protein ACFXHK_24635, partial [Embleya sp. NPDC059267]